LNAKKIALLALLAAGVTAFMVFDLGQYFHLAYIKQSQARFTSLHAEQPVLVTAVYFMLYVAVTALSLPGAAIMTLAGGAIFGLLWGTVLVSFASTHGRHPGHAGGTHAVARQHRAALRQAAGRAEQGRGARGPFLPVHAAPDPCHAVFCAEPADGPDAHEVRTYFWVSQLGMLAGTVVYVYAGTELAKVDSLRSVASPGLIGAFVLLGIFPLLTKKIVEGIQRRKVYARWRQVRPTRFDRNLVVIGAGAGGLVTAYIAAAVKAKVTLVESQAMGGDCLNFGCVPSKALIRTAKLRHQILHSANYGLAASTTSFRFREVMERIQRVIADIAPHDSVERYTSLGVDVAQGHARIVNPWTVEITLNNGGTRTLTTRNIVIAAGARPLVPPLPGLDTVDYVTSDTLWERFAQLDELPRRIVVLGGGPIGCELSQAFARLGASVIQVEMGPRIMVREDAEVSELARQALQADGVQVLTGHKALRCERTGDTKAIFVEHAGQEKRIEFDALICAVGRVARLTGYGLEELGIPTGRTIETNEYLQTLYPNIYAAGDVAGPYQFTHVAAHQAWYAAVNALFGDLKKFKADYSVIPWATFIDPEVARVGLNEQEAREQGIAYEVVKYGIDDLDRAIADSEAHGFVKVLTVPGKDRILGVTIVGVHAGDLLAEYVLAMKHGLGLNKILGTIHTYPTLSEANKYAAGEWKRAHQPVRLLEWVRKYHDWKRS
jgi:pyruvate/2-oxoglutarate dehydrogenase complex dihydrolipoamide dehydrogenase (E3) component/uncharacterized membrane protein YdjX (TVP38/TMEM64 family)